MTTQRWMWIFVIIALCAFALAALGYFVLAWPENTVGLWIGIGAGYLLGALVLRLLPRWWRDHCDESYATPAGKRYVRALWPVMAAYSLLMALSVLLLKQGIASIPLRVLVALLPMLPMVFMVLVMLRYWREIDELQRRIETEAIGISSLLVSMLYFAGGLLHVAKVINADAGVAMIWVFPLLAGIYGVAKIFLTKRYL